MRLSVVIPMYNEEAVIGESLQTLCRTLESALPENEYEVVAVNDGSTDRTEEIVSNLCGVLPGLRLLRLPGNSGKGGALRRGMTAAKGDFVLFTDSDLAYGCPMILQFLKDYEEGKGRIVIGSRALAQDGYAGYTKLRVAASKCYLAVVRRAAGFSFTDSQCGIKGFCKEAAQELFGSLETTGFAFDLEILLRAGDAGYSVYEQPVRVLRHGASSVRPVRDALRMLRDLAKIKKRRAARQKAASGTVRERGRK